MFIHVTQKGRGRDSSIIPYNPFLDEKRHMFKGSGIDIVFKYPNTLRNTLIKHNVASGGFETSSFLHYSSQGLFIDLRKWNR